jgi:hypothetical protein
VEANCRTPRTSQGAENQSQDGSGILHPVARSGQEAAAGMVRVKDKDDGKTFSVWPPLHKDPTYFGILWSTHYEVFWYNVKIVPEGCLLWKGPGSKAIGWLKEWDTPKE